MAAINRKAPLSTDLRYPAVATIAPTIVVATSAKMKGGCKFRGTIFVIAAIAKIARQTKIVQ
jgi:hypothetical protein